MGRDVGGGVVGGWVGGGGGGGGDYWVIRLTLWQFQFRFLTDFDVYNT